MLALYAREMVRDPDYWVPRLEQTKNWTNGPVKAKSSECCGICWEASDTSLPKTPKKGPNHGRGGRPSPVSQVLVRPGFLGES